MGTLKLFIDVRKERSWWVATELYGGVADQGRTQEAAVKAVEDAVRERVPALLRLEYQSGGRLVREIEFWRRWLESLGR